MPPYVQPIAVRFRDIDALDHVNHAVMLSYCETVRCDWFTANGYPSMAGLPFIIACAHIEYKAPIQKTDPVQVVMWTSRMGSKSWDFDYIIENAATKAVFATVKTVQVGFDYATQSTQAPNDALKTKLAALTAPA